MPLQHLPGICNERSTEPRLWNPDGEMKINNIRYADDTTLLGMVFEKLQLSTDELERACAKWGMKINPTNARSCQKTQEISHLTSHPLTK
jgi:hypothetical protein